MVRTQSKIRIAVALAGAGYLVLLTGCAGPLERRGVPEAIVEGEGASWSMVFSSPGVQRHQDMATMSDPRLLPEYGRNDRAMNPESTRAQLAQDQWPQRPRADLRYSRSITLPTRAETVQFFESRERYYEGGYWSGGWGGGYGQSNYPPSGGYWGFWR